MSFESTSNFDLYQKYLLFKSNNRYVYKGIDLIKCLSVDLLEVFVAGNKKTIKDIADSLCRRLRVGALVETVLDKDVIITCDLPKRVDHVSMVRTLSNKLLPYSCVYILRYKFLPYFNILQLFRAWLYLYKTISKAEFKYSTKKYLYIAAKIVYYIRLTDMLHKAFDSIELSKKKYIPLNSTAYTESLLTLFFKQSGMSTYHIFHGIFGRYQHFIPNDVVNGENIHTDVILSFSDGQKRDLCQDFQVDSRKVYVAGNLKYKANAIKVVPKNNKWIILGGIGLYDEYLLRLFPIVKLFARETGAVFYLKLHPLSNIQISQIKDMMEEIVFIDKSLSLHDILESGNFSCAIIHNTSSYYECMYNGIKPFRWAVGANIDYCGMDDTFSSLDELLSKYNDYKSIPGYELQKMFTNVLRDEFGIGIDRYRELILFQRYETDTN